MLMPLSLNSVVFTGLQHTAVRRSKIRCMLIVRLFWRL